MISTVSFLRTSLLARLALFLGASAILPGSSLFLGFNTLTPVQVFDQNGNYVQDFGPAGSISAFPDGSGHYFSVTPSSSSGSSSVIEYSGTLSSGGSLVPTGSFTLNDVITDGGSDSGSLVFSAFNGTVYRTTATGSILNSWSTGFSHIGVTSNGTNVYTTEGDAGNLINIWSSSFPKSLSAFLLTQISLRRWPAIDAPLTANPPPLVFDSSSPSLAPRRACMTGRVRGLAYMHNVLGSTHAVITSECRAAVIPRHTCAYDNGWRFHDNNRRSPIFRGQRCIKSQKQKPDTRLKPPTAR